jgi:RHS repeat-associated protein
LSYTYDTNGNLLTRTDANGHVTSFVYDPLGRVTEQTDALMGAARFEYTDKGQVSKVTDALGSATEYKYDAAGRVTTTTSPDTGKTAYAYNATGTLSTKTDATGITIKYVYDTLNRLTEMAFPDASQNIAYTYDHCTNGKGRVCTMSDPTGTTAYVYDKLGRVASEAKVVLKKTYTTDYAYDKAGNLTSITYPSGRKVTYSLDKLNRPDSVTATLNGTMTLAGNFSYDPLSNLKAVTLGNQLTESRTYDAASRIHTISVPGIMAIQYAYDPAGNITSIADTLNPANSKTYTYDSLDRLASAIGPWGTLAWTYDANGNRLSQVNGEQYSYTYAANRLQAVGNGHTDYYQYDDNGNTTSDGRRDFVYNQNLRLIRAERHGRMLGEYVYNGNGQRIIKSTEHDDRGEADERDDDDSRHITVFHYDPSGRLLEETTAKGKLIADYVYLNGKPLAMIRKQEHKDETFYYHNDHLGTPKILTDKNKKIVWNAEFDPFGNELDGGDDADPDKVGEGGHQYHDGGREYIRNVINNLRFPGQYYDAETGLHYNYYRDYNPVIGKYIEADPIGIQKGRNHLYTYAANNPVKHNDPKGLWAIYGNWCGPNWTGGSQEQYNPNNAAIYAANDSRIDSLDRCCRTHDRCFYRCRLNHPCDAWARRECMIECNRALADCASSADCAQDAGIVSGIIAWWMSIDDMPDAGSNDSSCPCSRR